MSLIASLSLCRRVLVLVLFALIAPPSARAQHPGPGGHPLPTAPRAPHALVADADAAVIGTIEGISTGRIRVRDAREIFGTTGASFEIKRAPSNPPTLAEGERRILLLRGARSPWLLVGGPRDQLPFSGADADARAAEVLVGLHEALHDAARLRDLYLRWFESTDDALRGTALRGLGDPLAPFHPIPDEPARHHAARAVNAALSLEERRAAAIVAGLVPAGIEAMLATLPLGDDPAGPALYELALASGLMRRAVTPVLDALERGLVHASSDVRRVAVRYARGVTSPGLVRALQQVAASDVDALLRGEAAKLLAERAATGAP